MTTDHFSTVASQYAAFRPDYPTELFDWVSSLVPQHELVWDCGAGSGQATAQLATRFERVIATDISAAQISSAPTLKNVQYRVAPAENSGLLSASCDLVTVAQAMHWFDLPKFYSEVKRVLKPQGIIVAWGYNLLFVKNEAIQAAVNHFYSETVGPYWPPERAMVENGYADLPFPFVQISPPSFALSKSWTLDHLLGYLHSWSAVARFHSAHGYNPVDLLEPVLTPLWPKGQSLSVEWPVFILAGSPDFS